MTTMTKADLENLSISQLKNWVERGIVRVDMLTETYPTTMTKFETPEYLQVSHLRGVAIGVREASRKYKVPSPTISRWIKRGIISIIGKSANKLLIDEADVAYCSNIRSQKPGAGKWLFNSDGTPR